LATLRLFVDGGTTLRRLRSSCSVQTGATVVASKTEEYRAKARECEERAAQMPDSYLKEQMLEVAKKWRNMAAYEEKYGR
jgi:hypothetical protein